MIAEMLTDIAFRYEHSVGEPPREILASRNLRWLLFKEINEFGYPIITAHNLPKMEKDEFEFYGIRVICRLDTEIPTAVAIF